MVNQFEDGLTRRAALRRFALLAGGAAAAQLAPLGTAIAAPAPGFNSQRQKVFHALAEAYDGQGPINAAEKNLAAAMSDRYASATDDYRTWIDTLLDAVDSAPDGSRLSDLSVAQRRDVLRSWNRATEPSDELMHKPRPSDASEPADIRKSAAQASERIRAFKATLPPGALDLDPVTLLPKYAPPAPPKAAITTGGPLDTPIRLRRYLRHSCYVLLVSFFEEDTRYLTDKAFA